MIWARRSLVSFVAASNKDDCVSFGRSQCLGRFCFCAKSEAEQTASLTDFPCFTYTLDNHSTGEDGARSPATWYVPLTSFSNTKTLPETRGPNFRLPPSVVATICRVRDLECETNLWSFWCKWLDTCESYQQLPVPSEMSKVDALQENLFDIIHESSLNPQTDKVRRPTVKELIDEIKWRLEQTISSSNHSVTTIVVAGEGEPTLRLQALMKFIDDLRKLNQPSHPIQLRILTNGLLSSKKTHQLLSLCCQNRDLPIEFSVALMTHDSMQYNKLMEPRMPSSKLDEFDASEPSPHLVVQHFINAVVALRSQNEQTPTIEVTAVDRPDVNVTLTNELAGSLRVTKPIRWRRYYE